MSRFPIAPAMASLRLRGVSRPGSLIPRRSSLRRACSCVFRGAQERTVRLAGGAAAGRRGGKGRRRLSGGLARRWQRASLMAFFGGPA